MYYQTELVSPIFDSSRVLPRCCDVGEPSLDGLCGRVEKERGMLCLRLDEREGVEGRKGSREGRVCASKTLWKSRSSSRWVVCWTGCRTKKEARSKQDNWFERRGMHGSFRNLTSQSKPREKRDRPLAPRPRPRPRSLVLGRVSPAAPSH